MSSENLKYKGKKFSKAPIVEAVFEMRFPINLSIDTKKDQFYSFIQTDFPNIRTPQPSPFEHHLIQPISYYSNDGSQNLNCSVSKFAVITRSYNTFHEFKEGALKYVSKLVELYGVREINRLGLRYINHIQIPKGSVSDYLNFGFRLPGALSSGELLDFQTILVTKLEKGHVRTVIARDRKETGNLLILDNDVIFEGSFSASALGELLTEMHDKIETIFLDMLVDKYIKEIV